MLAEVRALLSGERTRVRVRGGTAILGEACERSEEDESGGDAG
jgi:hypothetical protein